MRQRPQVGGHPVLGTESSPHEVSVQANGCYKAQSPPAFLGGPTMSDVRGRRVTNPLFIVYGCFNVL